MAMEKAAYTHQVPAKGENKVTLDNSASAMLIWYSEKY
jgi:hypothetical protein